MYQVAIVEDDAEQAEILTQMIDGFHRHDELAVTCLSGLPELESYAGGGASRRHTPHGRGARLRLV